MKLQSFRNDQRGAIAVMFAFLLPVMIIASALGIESMRVLREKTRLQNALDAAALAAGQARFGGETDVSIRAIVDEMVRANLAGSELATPTVTIRTGNGADANRLTLDATASLRRTGIGGSGGAFEIQAHSAAETSNQKVEVSLVLDTTLSMQFDGKMDQLKSSAKRFVEKLMLQPDRRSPRPNVSIAVVPFNDYVWLSTRDYGNRSLDWLTDTTDRTETTRQWVPQVTQWDCQGGYVVTPPQGCSVRDQQRLVDGRVVTVQGLVCDVIGTRTCPGGMVSTIIPGYFRDVTTNYRWYGAVGSRRESWDTTIDNVGSGNKHYAYLNLQSGVANRSDGEAPGTLQRLTSDKTRVDYVIDRLVPHRETYTAPGLLWGWHALDPGAPFGDGAAYGSAQKVIILMTDGVNTKSTRPVGTTGGYAIHDGGDFRGANAKTAQLCASIKARGVKVYSIAYMFEIGNDIPAAKQMLQSCASDNARFFDATSRERLDRAFMDIFAELIPLRLAE